MDEPKQKIKPLVRGVRDAVAKEVLSARNIPASIVRGSVPEAGEIMRMVGPGRQNLFVGWGN